MNEQEEHVKQFLTSSTYNQLSANQQKHAQDILVRFNQQMTNEQHLADTAWTPQAVKEVMVGDFIADPALTNQFGIAVAPVLKAYQKFLGVDQLKEIVQAIDDQRANMNACRKAHKTWAQLHGADATEEQPSPVAKPTTKLTQQAQSVKVQPTKQTKTVWNEEKLAKLIDQVKCDMPTAPEFQHQALSLGEQQYVVAEFLNLMHQEFNEYPDEWVFADLQRVLGMMMPLDPAITPKQIKNIVPTAQALFDYLKQNGVITMDQYKVGMKAIANMQNSQEMLASLSRKERETQLMLSFINSNGIDTDDVQAAEAWMDDHRDEVAAFMRKLLNPWRDYEHQQLVKRQEAARCCAQLSSANGGKITHHRAPQGIKFSKKARKKRRRK